MISRLTLIAMATLSSSCCLGAVVIPRATDLEVRLLTQLGSRCSKRGDHFEATVISPIAVNDTIFSLQGSRLVGTVVEAHAVGWGLRRATADLKVRFDSIRLPDGSKSQITGDVSEVETARESVEQGGRIRGIDPAANLSAGFSFLMSTVLVHTELEIPALIIKVLTARSPDSDIVLPVGTEMFVRLKKDATLNVVSVNHYSPENVPLPDLLHIKGVLDDLPSQRVQFASHRFSDLLNLALLGTEAQVRDAFAAAGWTGESKHSPMALYGFFHSLVQRQGFPMAPMAALTLNGRPATATFQKSLNTITKRHHIRLWRQADTNIWFGAATEDVGLTISHMHLTHSTAGEIDNERAKVINDLWFAGCVPQASFIPRDHSERSFIVPDQISTDGNLAVLRVSRCVNAAKSPTESRTTQARLLRATVAVAADAVRSNPVTVGLVTAHTLRALFRHADYNSLAINSPKTRVSIIDFPKERLSLSAAGKLQQIGLRAAPSRYFETVPPHQRAQNK